jgi:hypothetical protein
MPRYRLVLFYGGGAPPKSISVELDAEPRPGTRVEAKGHTWHVLGPHVREVGPGPLQLEIEPGAFDCQLVD